MDEKLTDTEIVKALECKTKAELVELCIHLQAEIKIKNKLLDIAEAKFETIKAEAYKEFAEKVKEWLCKENELYISCAKNMLSKDFQNGYEQKNDFVIKLIDTLLKELVGEQVE